MLEIQKFINEFPSIRDANRELIETISLKIKLDSLVFPNGAVEQIYIYNYDLLESPHDNPIANECRGLILDMKGNVISYPLARFFNAHEGAAATIDWDSAKAFDKHDGTMIAIYTHREHTFIQTRGSAVAEGPVSGMPHLSYSEAVKALLIRKHGGLTGWAKGFAPPVDWAKDFAPGFIYIFEFVAPYNRIVTPYDKPDLYLLTIRGKPDLIEMDNWVVDDVAEKLGYKRPASIRCVAKAGVLSMIEDLDPTDEGFVVVDKNFNRVKIKNPRYLAISRAVNAGAQLSPRHFAAVTLNGDGDETKGYFPEYADAIDLFITVLANLGTHLQELWAQHGELERKPFALKVKHHPFSGVLFGMKSQRISTIGEGLSQEKPDKLVSYVRKHYADEFKLIFDELINTGGKDAG